MLRSRPALCVALAGAGLVSASTNISWWQTARDTGDRLTPQVPLTFQAGSLTAAAGANVTTVTVNSSARFQTVIGFGGAITESAVYVLGKLPSDLRAQVLDDLYGENADGTSLRYTLGRLTIGSCDFSLGYYNYNEMANDTEMTNFTIAHDEATIIPLILQAQSAAQAQGRLLQFLSTPWSPPGWMKSNGLMSCFPLGPLDCALLPEFQPAWALYLSRYISAYRAAGVNVFALTVQNEPQPQTGTLTYEGMWFPFTAELEFVAEYLGPRLAADHPDVKLFVFDHNQADAAWYATPILADPVASKYVDGVAFHWYSGPDWTPLQELQGLFPETMLLASEATAGRGTTPDWYVNGSWATGEYYGTFILNDLAANAVGFIDWNIALDEKGGPDHGDPTGELCEGLIQCGSDAMLIVDTTVSPPVVYKQAFYWYMAHVSRFVLPGSARLAANITRSSSNATSTGRGNGAAAGRAAAPGPASGDGSSPILAVPFTTADGSTALVTMNQQDTEETLVVQDARYGSATVTMPPHSIQTWIW